MPTLEAPIRVLEEASQVQPQPQPQPQEETPKKKKRKKSPPPTNNYQDVFDNEEEAKTNPPKTDGVVHDNFLCYTVDIIESPPAGKTFYVYGKTKEQAASFVLYKYAALEPTFAKARGRAVKLESHFLKAMWMMFIGNMTQLLNEFLEAEPKYKQVDLSSVSTVDELIEKYITSAQ